MFHHNSLFFSFFLFVPAINICSLLFSYIVLIFRSSLTWMKSACDLASRHCWKRRANKRKRAEIESYFYTFFMPFIIETFDCITCSNSRPLASHAIWKTPSFSLFISLSLPLSPTFVKRKRKFHISVGKFYKKNVCNQCSITWMQIM